MAGHASLIAVFLTASAFGQPGPVHYRGLQQTPLGAATIALDTNDQLVVSNIGSSGKDGFGPMNEIHLTSMSTSALATVSFMPGSVKVDTDEIRISLTGLPAGSAMPPIQALEMRVANVPQLIVSDEALGAFGSAHRGLGIATMSATLACHDCLVISNIGASGDDGVCAEPDDDHVGAYGSEITPTSSHTVQSAARLRVNELESRLASLTLFTDYAILGTQISVDFSDLGASTYTTGVFLGGSLIGTASGLSGSAAQQTGYDHPECIIWDIKDSCAHAEADWDPPLSLFVNGLGSLTADRLRITADLPAGPGGPIAFEAIEDVAMTGTNLAELAINAETVTLLLPCPWDCGDNDGIVGINDFLTLLSQWNTAGPCDFDGGGVRVTDFLDLLANWGPCP